MCVGTINALDPTCPRTCVAFVTVLLSAEAIKVCSITFGMAAEPSDESKWLKSHYEEAATGDVPTPSKRVKYQTLKGDIELHFPHRTYNDLVVKGFIKEAFPMSSTLARPATRTATDPLHFISAARVCINYALARDRHQASWACGLLHPRSLIFFALFWVRSSS